MRGKSNLSQEIKKKIVLLFIYIIMLNINW